MWPRPQPRSLRVAAELRRRALLKWYRQNGRDLPWRRLSDPWAILVSEVMSQQTQIARVIPAWRRFLDRYPTPNDLVGADRAELIRLWDGLGYQRRAFNLQRAAEMIDRCGWPTDVGGLSQLPGVGPYTAAAVACFAFEVPVPAVETNLRRILSRWHGTILDGADLERIAAEELADGDASGWNQALMDLGATICHPRQPNCGICPVQSWCDDPSIYQPPPRQSRYRGSVRQARAAVVKQLARTQSTEEAQLASVIGLEAATVATAVSALEAEQIIEREEGWVRLTSSG